MCSWNGSSERFSPGVRRTPDAIVRPRSTDAETSSSATTPAARLASHQACCRGRSGHAAASQPDDGTRAQRAARLDLAVVADDQAAVACAASGARRPAPTAARPWPAPRPRGRSARAPSRRRARSRPARRSRDRAGGARAGRRGAPQPDVRARRSPPPPSVRCSTWARSPVSGCSISISNGSDAGAADAQVAAAVDRPARRSRAERGRGEVGGQALARAAGVDAQARAGGARARRASSTSSARQRCRRVRTSRTARRGAGKRRGERQLGRPPAGGVARGLELADQRRDRPARRCARPPSGPARTASTQEGGRRDVRRGCRVQRAQLAVGAEAAQPRLVGGEEVAQLRDDAGAGRVDEQPHVRPHGGELDVVEGHDVLVTSGAGAGAGAAAPPPGSGPAPARPP